MACMTARSITLIILTTLITFIAPSNTLRAGEENLSAAVNEYRYEDYIRHPRMEEEDRLRGRTFTFAPGLEIIANVDDADITIHGKHVGKTPWESSAVPPGTYRVRLSRRGFTPRELWIDVFSDRRVVVEVEIEASTGTLRLTGVPENAVIRFSRKRFVGDILEVTSGTGVLIIRAFGWETVESPVEVPAGKEVIWEYPGSRVPFDLGEVSVSPKSLPARDNEGFRIRWRAAAPGRGKLTVRDPRGRVVYSEPLEFSAEEGHARWIPADERNLSEGNYTAEIIGRASGEGPEAVSAAADAGLRIDNRFSRSPVPFDFSGAGMLPPGVSLTAVGASLNAQAGVPVTTALLHSPAARIELRGRFTLRIRAAEFLTAAPARGSGPLRADSNAPGLGLSLGASWRITPRSGLFAANVSLGLSYEGSVSDFAALPRLPGSRESPGLHVSLPMELNPGRWRFILTPSADLILLGGDSARRRIAGPVRLAGTLEAGILYDAPGFLIGIVSSLQSSDLPGGFFERSLGAGVRGRIDMPGGGSYIGLRADFRFPALSPSLSPSVSAGLELGLVG